MKKKKVHEKNKRKSDVIRYKLQSKNSPSLLWSMAQTLKVLSLHLEGVILNQMQFQLWAIVYFYSANGLEYEITLPWQSIKSQLTQHVCTLNQLCGEGNEEKK